ncbi:MAG: TetR/AcrR family transcriptional regulator [Anaerolineales bacterium]|jgi:AcrR family transcriptional regulator
MPKVIDDKAVFRAALDALAAFGYESATTRNIAEAAGIHEATLFRKYGSKLNLIELAIKAHFLDVPLARVAYTGDLHADLLSIIEAYQRTSELVGNILPILLIEIPRNPEIKNLLDVPWENVDRIGRILEQYQEKHLLNQEPVLNTISVLIGPLMVRNLIKETYMGLPIPPIDPQIYVEDFLLGHGDQTKGHTGIP